MDKKFTVKKGKRVTIEINRKQPRNSKLKTQNLPPKGIIKTRREDAYLARRVGRGIYLNFYDFGQFTEDGGATWADLDYVVEKSINIDGGGYLNYLNGLELSDWTAFKDIVFATPKEDWSSVFRKLDYERAERYGIDIYLGKLDTADVEVDMTKYLPVGRNGSRTMIQVSKESDLIADSKWTQRGLLIETAQTAPAFSLLTQNGFINMLYDEFDNKNYKVTTEDNYAAAAAEFLIDASTDFYLFPMLNIETAISQVSANEAFLNLLYTSLQREFFIDGNGWNPGEWAYNAFVKRDIHYEGAATANTNWILNFMKNRSEARMYVETDFVFSPAAGFPASGGVYQHWLGLTAYSASYDTYARLAAGALIAMAKKSGVWYYFWANFPRPNYHRLNTIVPSPAKFRLSIS